MLSESLFFSALLFTIGVVGVLTPNFNRPHRNHFHLEVMANKKWFLVH